MIHWDSAQAEERNARERREEAVRKLITAKRYARHLLVIRTIMVVCVVCDLVYGLSADSAVTLGAAAFCAGIALFNWYLRSKALEAVAARESELRHVQREYDEVFARMIADEQNDQR